MGNCAGVRQESHLDGFNGLTLETLTLDKLQIKRGKEKPPTKQEIFEQMQNRKLSSGIFLEFMIHTSVPLDEKYDLHYSYSYSNSQKSWIEREISTPDY